MNIYIALQEILALIEVLIDKVESPDLCNVLMVVLTFNLRHEEALGSKYCRTFGKLNYMTQNLHKFWFLNEPASCNENGPVFMHLPRRIFHSPFSLLTQSVTLSRWIPVFCVCMSNYSFVRAPTQMDIGHRLPQQLMQEVKTVIRRSVVVLSQTNCTCACHIWM